MMRPEICHKREVFISGLKGHNHGYRRPFDIEATLVERKASGIRNSTLASPSPGRGKKQCAGKDQKKTLNRDAAEFHHGRWPTIEKAGMSPCRPSGEESTSRKGQLQAELQRDDVAGIKVLHMPVRVVERQIDPARVVMNTGTHREVVQISALAESIVLRVTRHGVATTHEDQMLSNVYSAPRLYSSS